ncbi:MAG: TrkH family potassium uptake protein [Spirochaetes bacterium]|nr:TrkH family potassium uptake protein [Spirochaetota bacterium]
MLLRPRASDVKVIGLYTGRIIMGVGLLMTAPLATAVIAAEWAPAVDFLIGMCACFCLGLLAEICCRTTRELTWTHGMVVAGFSWLAATVVGAIPHWLSGHYGSWLDAMFDLMSGYTTTGLILIQDLDHISNALNMWRHLLTFAGGQGIVVIALTFLVGSVPGAYPLYVGEGKDERLLPNVVRTARAIWLVSLVYLAVGTPVLWLINVLNGQSVIRGFLHALWMFMSAWSTGGFAPQSYNGYYYHSLAFEIACVIIFVAGSMNFALHWAVWTGRRSEIRRNIEIVSFTITMTVFMLITTAGLMKLGVYPDFLAALRKMFYQVISGHTTTGLSTIYSRAFVRQWGPLAMLGITLAMAFGASASSTAGGFKGIRVGLVFKGLLLTVRRSLAPERARVVVKWHHLRTRVLDEAVVSSAMLVVICYVTLYALGTIVGVLYGYPLAEALFDAVSAGSNSGLSCGITGPAMPALMKVVYLFEMWVGRLEFMSVLALGGYVVSLVRGR